MVRINFSEIEDINENPTSADYIGHSKSDHLYISEFDNGKYITQNHDVEISPRVKMQFQVVYIKEKKDINNLNIIKCKLEKNNWVEKERVSFSKFDFTRIKAFLEIISNEDLANIHSGRLPLNFSEDNTTQILEMFKDETFKNTFLDKDKNQILKMLSIEQEYSKRVEIIKEFKLHMDEKDWNENNWQYFFEQNKWIFGYSLNIKILNGQTNFGGTDYTRKGEQKGDFFTSDMGVIKFTIPVEIKCPDTQLVKDIYRNHVYELGKDLVGGVCQIQSYCNKWQEESIKPENIDALESKSIYTCLPRGILIIGNKSQLDDRNKRNTFELYRRNLHNPEIITYDELYERAKFIVENLQNNEQKQDDELICNSEVKEDEELPF